ncbi:MAG: CHAP domain-containing protein [Chloroflexi bacterium]|nr:CHAP domain-containing protein [Chloroflexota bacterium]
MNMQFGFKVSGILIIFALLLVRTPTSVVYSQTGEGYTCGSFQRLDAGTRGFPAFVPYGFENDQSGWWIVENLDHHGNLFVTSTGEEIDPIDHYGQYLQIWNPDIEYYSAPYLMSVSDYQWVTNCNPAVPPTNTPEPIVPLSVIFWADNTTLMAGQCTNLNWSVTGSGITGVYIGDQAFSPIGNANICLSSSTTYTLLVYSSQGNQSSVVTINVLYPTNTPVPPTATPLPPTRTKIPPSVTSIPPSPIPTNPSYDGALSGDGYEPSPSWLEKILQIFAPPVEASYSPTDCQSKFTVNNCTWFVADKRPDVCQWIQPGQGNAYQWTSQAQQNGSPFGVSVNKNPSEIGDIVVWSPYCAGSLEYGHVALVTGISSNGKTIDIDEMNWSIGNGHRTIDIADCMDFISNPAPVSTFTPTPITPPNPVIVPTPSEQPFNPFQWIIDLFK